MFLVYIYRKPGRDFLFSFFKQTHLTSITELSKKSQSSVPEIRFLKSVTILKSVCTPYHPFLVRPLYVVTLFLTNSHYKFRTVQPVLTDTEIHSDRRTYMSLLMMREYEHGIRRSRATFLVTLSSVL